MNLQHWDVQQPTQDPVLRHQPPGGSAGHLRFGRFCVVPGARQLFADGRPIRLGSRAFDLLVVLLNARGRLVSKDEIVNRVWPSLAVEESNLRFQMAALRRALGEDRDVIKTISGRGYLLAAEVARESSEIAVGEIRYSGLEPPGGGSDLRSAFGHWPSDSRQSGHSDTPPTIAVIDDDPGVRESLHGLFRSAGLRADLFASVQDFIDSPPASPPQCIVLDVWLPGRNGLDFHAELARADVNVPVIFISGHADVPMSVRAMKSGAVDFLTKPVHHLDLLNAISRAIQIASPG